MDKELINTDDALYQLIEKIKKAPLDFDHLKIFLKGDERTDWFENTEYLMVTPKSMTKVRLVDIDVEDNNIMLTIFDCNTGISGNVRIDINDTRPQCYFLRWSDVKQMVLDETTSGIMSNELLEFDFENAENQSIK